MRTIEVKYNNVYILANKDETKIIFNRNKTLMINHVVNELE